MRVAKGNGRAPTFGGRHAVTEAPIRPRPSPPLLVKRLLSAEEAGTYLGFKSAWPIRELGWKGMLPVVRIGKRRIMFDVQDLNRFIEERKTREVPGVF